MKGHGDKEVTIGRTVDVADPTSVLPVLPPLHQVGRRLMMVTDVIAVGQVVV